MDEVTPATSEHDGPARAVFISHATADRKEAAAVCDSIERRGIDCWISSRDIEPGANYQEEIVRSIRSARALVLVFSEAANGSDEIKKELSLASKHKVPMLALRIEDIEPSDAFAYELSTRQWIDAFEGWDKAINALTVRIEQLSGAEGPIHPAQPRDPRRARAIPRPWVPIAAGLLLLVLAAGALLLRSRAPTSHPMSVRLAGFQLLSADLPTTIRDSIDPEIAAAFNADGVVGVSTASAPPPGSAPAYALGGTLQRDGEKIRAITRLTNERSGETLWSGQFEYDGTEVSRVPRHIAVDAGNVVRCGLFGASTYRKPLPDAVLRDYLQFCQGHWDTNMSEGRKALVPAQRVVAAVPDFSWGWAAVAGAYWKVAMTADNEKSAEEARVNGRQAADRAVAIDSKNSEALYIKSMLVDRNDWLGRESLLKRAVAARRLDCGCEHHQYGWMLLNVGRVVDALDQLRRANDMLALYVYTPLTLADALTVAGKPDEASEFYDAAINLASDPGFAEYIARSKAKATDNTALLVDPKLDLPSNVRAALLKADAAVKLHEAGAKAAAVKALLALPLDQQDETVARLLAKLGANHEAFLIASRAAVRQFPGPTLFWHPSMRRVLSDPDFPALAAKLGLMKYWKTSGLRPDLCNEGNPPPFCRMI